MSGCHWTSQLHKEASCLDMHGRSALSVYSFVRRCQKMPSCTHDTDHTLRHCKCNCHMQRKECHRSRTFVKASNSQQSSVPCQHTLVCSGQQSLEKKGRDQRQISMTPGHIGVISLLAISLAWQLSPVHCANEPCLDLYKGVRRRSTDLPTACRFLRTLSAVHQESRQASWE